jgi:hypothetical protein
MPKQWYCIEISRAGQRFAYLGKCYASADEIRAACGPYAAITGNHVVIWGRP